MKKIYVSMIPLLTLLFICFNQTNAQEIINPDYVITTDNLSDDNLGTSATNGTLLSGPKYKEFPATNLAPTTNDGWWTNTIGFNGTHRRSTRQGAGNPTGSKAVFAFDIPETKYYMVYHHMINSGNSSTRCYVTFNRFGEFGNADSLIYNMRNNNLHDGRGSWYPLGMIQAFQADSGLSVTIGADSTSSNTLRVDAVRILRTNRTGPDIEFANRRADAVVIDPSGDTTLFHSFYRHRAPVDFGQTMFKGGGNSTRTLPIYNIGTQPLVITGFQTQTTRFSVTTAAPITIQPGQRSNITIRFVPLGEEVTFDTLFILNNDVEEPEALLPLYGEGINYNFVLNASAGGAEPHWNAPPPGGVYEEVGSFLNSATSPWPYPIPGGNVSSRVNTGSDPSIAVFYKFQLPDTAFGNYYLEYSGPAGSSNAATQLTVDVVTPFTDTMRVTGFNSRVIANPAPHWARIGGNRIFVLQSGGETVVRYTNPLQGGTELLRADLLRARMVPVAPDIATSLDPARILNFGSVSIYDSIRLIQQNYQRSMQIGSRGETPLVISEMYLENGTYFTISNMPQLPMTLPAIDGNFTAFLTFLPDSIRSYSDRLWIRSNDPNDTLFFVRISGQGVGTGIIVDDTDPTTYIYPTDVQTWGGAPDPMHMDKWYRISGQGGINQNRLLSYIYFTPPGESPKKVQWFPYIPFKPGSQVNEIDSFDVFVQIPTNSPNSTPRARYRVHHVDGVTDTIISQLNRTLGGGKIPIGRYKFLRGGQDSFGSGNVFGSVELINDTALVSAFYADSVENIAKRDSFLIRADAVILEQAGSLVGVAEPSLLPTEYTLSQNFPNPFNPTTMIRFTLPEISAVELKIYDILGREVTTLLRGEHPAGVYNVEWDGRNQFGTKVASGVYIYRIVAGKFVQTKKMMMLK
jgi:hypothetical protein